MKIDLEKQAKDIQRKLDTEKIGARDYGVYVNTLLNIQKQLESQSEGRWWLQLRELKEACESIEELQLGDSEKYRAVFENGVKKNSILLLA